MSELLSFAKKLQNFDAVEVLKQVMNSNESKELLIKLNTRDQLFDKGIDSEGVRLDSIGGGYTNNTIFGIPGQFEGKVQKGLPTDRVTLFSEGDLYQSFNIVINYPFIIFNYNDIKQGVSLTGRWGNNIAGLTDESKQEYEEFATGKALNIILQDIL